ncbi:MAG: acetyl-CoA carboxylase biotin carboxyl carrier protein [Armatimonadota bacterium]|nr:acetyl-CoA carboxylase biotin carboxyl carrier protein [Armatimonadota bacterium]MDR5696120.1 acetyl-CoA carboxylase biotin carboxyl carrier protein [Armatimonadota bacterium]
MENNERGALNFEEIRELVRIASEANITELEVEAGHLRVAIRKAAAPVPPAPALPPATVDNPGPAPAAAPPDTMPAHWVPVTAPMVGTFYRAPSPEAAPFVNEGDWVEEGRTLCIIEAMKMFNEIPADVSGRVVRILAENGAPVEYGQPLFLIDPRGQ